VAGAFLWAADASANRKCGELMSAVSTNNYSKAKYDAVEKLISNHRAEYEAILKAEKLKYGITPRLTKAERIAQLRSTLAQLEAEGV